MTEKKMIVANVIIFIILLTIFSTIAINMIKGHQECKRENHVECYYQEQHYGGLSWWYTDNVVNCSTINDGLHNYQSRIASVCIPNEGGKP
jgi:hypothetical protein